MAPALLHKLKGNLFKGKAEDQKISRGSKDQGQDPAQTVRREAASNTFTDLWHDNYDMGRKNYPNAPPAN